MHGGGGRPAPVAQLHILSKYFHIEFPVLMWHGNMAVVPIAMVAVANIKSATQHQLQTIIHYQVQNRLD